MGWGVRPQTESATLTTVEGIGIGSTLNDLKATYEGDSVVEVMDSSLGVEFCTNQLAGLISANEPDGVITDL